MMPDSLCHKDHHPKDVLTNPREISSIIHTKTAASDGIKSEKAYIETFKSIVSLVFRMPGILK